MLLKIYLNNFLSRYLLRILFVSETVVLQNTTRKWLLTAVMFVVAKYLFLTEKKTNHSVKSVRIQSYSGPYFPAFGLNTERYGVSLCIPSEHGKNADQNNSKYGPFSRREYLKVSTILGIFHLVCWQNFPKN